VLDKIECGIGLLPYIFNHTVDMRRSFREPDLNRFLATNDKKQQQC
jgi:hypothetical protein